MYAKAFTQILDSSVNSDCQVRWIFEDFLKLADIDGVVDMTREAIARRTNAPLELVNRAIIELEKADPSSRRPESEGRRLVRLDEHRDWGWIIVNYSYYRNLGSEEQRRAKTRVRVAKFREKERNAQVTLCNASNDSVRKSNDKEREMERERKKKLSDSSNPSDQSEINLLFVETAKSSVSTEELFENSIEKPPLVQKPASKLKKEKAVKKYHYDYNAVKIWCDLMTTRAKVNSPTVDGKEAASLSVLRNWYTEYQFRLMVAVYANERAGKPWDAGYFYKSRNDLRSKIWKLPEYREDIEFPPEKPAEVKPSENQEKKA